MKKKFYLLITGMFIVFCSCSSVPRNSGRITVNGMVYDTENRPAVNYEIYLDDRYLAITDIGGRFTLNNIKCGSYEFTGRGTAYLNTKETIEIYDKSQILYIKVPAIETKFQEAYMLITQNNYSQAEVCIKDVLDTDKNNSTAIFFMSVIKYLKGDIESSKEFKNQLLSDVEVTDYVKKLEKVLNNN